MNRLVCLLVLSSLVYASVAYPTLWVKEDEAIEDCTAIPVKKEGAHGAPVLDKTATFAVADAAGTPIKSACPGDVVTVTVTFTEERRYLLTASAGKFTGAPEPTCPNRVYSTKQDDPTATAEGTLTIPCNATGPIAVKVVSAAGKSAAFERAGTNITLKALAACPASKCPAAANKTANATAAANATAVPDEALPANETATAADANATAAAAAAPAPKSSSSIVAPASFLAAVVVVALSLMSL